MAGRKKKNAGTEVIDLEQGREKPKAPKKAFRYPGRGAPKVYETAEALAKGCEKYFASISRVEVQRDLMGNTSTNSLGKEVEQVIWLKQPSLGGLARSLGVSDRTLRNYADSEELGPVIEWAKGICRDWLLEEVTTREKGSLNGLIFVLQNNYGMRERIEMDTRDMTVEEWLARQDEASGGF